MKNLILGLYLLCFVFQGVSSQEVIPYKGPNLDKTIFDIEKLSLTKEERAEIATAIGCFVRDSQTITSEKGLLQSAKLLGIALRLDDKNRDAVIINSKLKRDVREAPVVPLDKGLPVLTKILQSHAKNLNQQTGEPDKKLAAYLYDLIVDLDPKNDDAVYELETTVIKMRRDWSWAVQTKAEVPSYKPERSYPQNPYEQRVVLDLNATPVKLNQTTVKGLIMYSTEAGKKLGTAVDIILTFARNDYRSDIRIDNNKRVGQEMSESFKEALTYFKIKYPSTERGDYKFTFGDRYSDKNGGSAGAAFALALFSLFDGFKIDPKCSITGDINIDGKIRGVSGVIEKIQGAVTDKCSIVCIPSKNSPAFRDYIVLNGVSSIKDVHVFSVQYVDDAKKIMAIEKDTDIIKGMVEFNEICKKTNLLAPLSTVNRPEVVKQLEDLKTRLPGYENVSVLIDVLNSKLEKNLSLLSSLERIFVAADIFLPYLEDRVKHKEIEPYQDMDENRQVVIRTRVVVRETGIMSSMNRQELPVLIVKNKLEELKSLISVIDPKLKSFNFELIAFSTNLDKFVEDAERNKKASNGVALESLYSYKQFEISRAILKKSIGDFKDEDKIIEKMLRATMEK